MTTALIIISSILTIAAIVPYALEVIKGTTKPRIVSWITWSLLTGIAAAATFSEGHMASGILLTVATLETLSIVVLGWRYGSRSIERLDVICQIGAVAGLVLWFLFSSPLVAVLATVTIDLIGCLPTIKHSWQKPHEETAITFALSGLGATATVFAVGELSLIGLAYPVYLVLANAVVASVIWFSPHRKLAGEPAELRDL